MMEQKARVEVLALALTELGNHAAEMVTEEVDHHDDCLWCETMVLLSRVTRFGKQLRTVDLQEMSNPRVGLFCGLSTTHDRHGWEQSGRRYLCHGIRNGKRDEMGEFMYNHGHEAVPGSDEGYGPRVRND